MTTPCKRDNRRGGLIAGTILITVGTVFLLTKNGLLDPQLLRQWWPLVLIAVGAGLVLRRLRSDRA